MRKLLISVITATLNDAEGLQESFESVLAQNFTQVEYVVVDGASTDHTIKVINQYEKEFIRRGLRLNWISEKDDGIYDALNKGIDMAQGEYLIFMGAGDYFPPNIFSAMHNILETHRYHLVCGNAYDKAGRLVYKGTEDARELIKECICHQSIFYRFDVFHRVGYYSLKYPIGADYDFNLRCFSPKNELKIHYINQMVAVYKGGGISAKQKDTIFAKEFPDIIRANFGEEMLLYCEKIRPERLIQMGRGYISRLLRTEKINSGDQFIIYGTAEWGQRFCGILKTYKLKILAFSDSNPDKWYQKFNDYDIIPPEKIKDTEFTKILLASSAYAEIRRELIETGHRESDILYYIMM